MRPYLFVEGFFRSKWLSKLLNSWFFFGQQQQVEFLVYASFFLMKKKLDVCPLFYFFEVLEKIKPMLGLKIYKQKNRKVNKHLIVPYILKVSVRYKKAIYWFIRAVKTQKGGVLIKVVQEILDVLFSVNSSVCILKKKECYNHALLFKKAKKFKW
jgi:ribosomal protein S7